MPNPAADYPSSVHSAVDISGFGNQALGDTTPTHTQREGKMEEEMEAIQTKIGPGSSTPGPIQVLGSIFGGDSLWMPLVGTYQGLGMNFGNDQIGEDPFPTDQNQRDLNILRRWIPSKRLRIAIPYHLQTNAVANAKDAVLMALAAGFDVTYGVTAGATCTLGDYNTWKNTSVPAAALWASQNGVKTFYIGNEEDWNSQASFDDHGTYDVGGKTPTQIRDDVRALATTLKAAYPEMRIVYSTAQGTVLGWDSEGTGDLDALGLNMYDTLGNFYNNIQYFMTLSFGDKMFVSEFGPNGPYPADAPNDDAFRYDLFARVNFLRESGLEAYYYTWRDAGDDWGLRLMADESYRPGFAQIFTKPTV